MAAVFFYAAISDPAQAADPGEFHAYGAGLLSCGKWLAARKGNDWYENGQWVFGWVSAAGNYNVQGSLRHSDSLALAAWVDKYCRENPLKTVAQASAALVDELAKPN
jgi:hypothetical protein